jgi:hypothetical protein
MEKWKPIPGYEGIYEASNSGKIRTASGKTTKNARFPARKWKQRILKAKTQARKNGKHYDLRVSLWKDGKGKTFLVSRLVAMTWCQGFSEEMTVNHKDGNPLNNAAENLEWVSLRKNIQHAFSSGIATNQKSVTLIAPDGSAVSFRSLSEASRHLGRNNGYISCCMERNKNIYDVNGNVYEVAG